MYKNLENAYNTTIQDFSNWLSERPPFDFVLDGPNIAYFGQNFQGGRFQYAQIQRILDYWKKRDKRVLVVMPWKYTVDVIPNHSQRNRNESTYVREEEMDIVRGWANEVSIIYSIICVRI